MSQPNEKVSGIRSKNLIDAIRSGYIPVEVVHKLLKYYKLEEVIQMLSQIVTNPFFMRSGKPITCSIPSLRLKMERPMHNPPDIMAYDGWKLTLALVDKVDFYAKLMPGLDIVSSINDGNYYLIGEFLSEVVLDAEVMEKFNSNHAALYAGFGTRTTSGLQEIISMSETKFAEYMISALAYATSLAFQEKIMQDTLGHTSFIIRSNANPEVGILVTGESPI